MGLKTGRGVVKERRSLIVIVADTLFYKFM
jgi:hypothetical protein